MKKTIIYILLILVGFIGVYKITRSKEERDAKKRQRELDAKKHTTSITNEGKINTMKNLVLTNPIFGNKRYKDVEQNTYYVNNFAHYNNVLHNELNKPFFMVTNESNILNVFSDLKNAYQISFLAAEYENSKHSTLRADMIAEKLSDEFYLQLYDIINAYND